MIVGCLSAVNLAEQAGLYPQVSKTYAMLGLVAGSMRMPGVARDHLERAARYADQIGDLEGRLFSEICAIAYHVGNGELAMAEARALAAQEMADRLGDPHERSMVEVSLGHIEYFTGRHAEAAERYGRVTAEAQRNDNPQHHAWGLYARARSLVRSGSYGEAAVLAEAARALLAEQADRASEIIALGVLALARLGLGEDEAAKSAAYAALEVMGGDVPTMFATLPGYSAVAHVFLELWARADEKEERRALSRAAAKACRALRAQALTFPLAAPAADLHVGHSLLLEGRTRRARSRLRRAAERARELGMPWEEGVALSLLATFEEPQAEAARVRARRLLLRMGAEMELGRLEAGEERAREQ
jgi:tetratricopeptide (TPR) repeat protein